MGRFPPLVLTCISNGVLKGDVAELACGELRLYCISNGVLKAGKDALRNLRRHVYASLMEY